MSENENKILRVAVDDGYAQTKLFGEDENGGVVKFCMRSSVRSGRYGLGSISGQGAVGLYETDEDGAFTVSEDVEAENTQFDGFHLSTMNRVLVSHALVSAGYGGKEVAIMTGLPVADFFVNGEKDVQKLDAKSLNLMKPVRLESGETSTAVVKNVRVGCQAVAAWFDYAFDDDFNERVDLDGAVAIVDIGGRTTDIATVVSSSNPAEGARVDFQRSGTANIGVLDVYKAVESAIGSKFKIRDRFPTKQIDDAVRNGTIKLWGKDNDVSAIVDDVIKEHQAKIVREVDRRIQSGASMNAIVFVGGGSALFKKIADDFQNGVMAEDPEFANARGLFKFFKNLG